jgi:hypothetical protein
MTSGKGLYKSYQKAGEDFLTYRMEKLFVRIETPEDIALHNDILSEVLQMIEGEETQFFRGIATAVLYPRVNKRKRFLFRVAGQIMRIGQKKIGA